MTNSLTAEATACEKAPEGWTHRLVGDTCLYCNEVFVPPRIQGFICMSREMRWGWGATPEEAVKQARKANGGTGARKGDRLVYALPAGAVDAYVDQMGAVNWTWADDAPDRTAIGVTIEEPRD